MICCMRAKGQLRKVILYVGGGTQTGRRKDTPDKVCERQQRKDREILPGKSPIWDTWDASDASWWCKWGIQGTGKEGSKII